ncbi:MAG: hypothetical protein EOP84_22105 [Verrucomicrobiaceae bacterium]|nr:MAG: hypothetical protein EOP84_22105 [Verrucomicrobiaceae bacterium]
MLNAVRVQGKRNQLEAQKDVPQSVSVVTGTELTRLDATTITEVLNRVGNVNFNYGNPRTGSLTLRGITTGSNDQIDPTVGTVLDGVSIAYSPITNGYPFIDIDNVNVTRGPQGTQGGKPSNIGRISFKTKAPSFTPSAEFSQTFGDWDTLRSTAIFGGPVIDGFILRRPSVCLIPVAAGVHGIFVEASPQAFASVEPLGEVVGAPLDGIQVLFLGGLLLRAVRVVGHVSFEPFPETSLLRGLVRTA